ncbi:unnamed protein product [Bursaphelenchus xylophilus]|uniref:(pine wood nematode) hypothetical protein n=1 Tax=Bursaphelenchus xylophilus TaxID=6326 RepID=A0A1I7SDX7_BURXY|nr:unnamed protein product [Bursaphelenchus xylophilus]CAG9100354.1 unnamed protein product [Bursaphelenchus xylophilus]
MVVNVERDSCGTLSFAKDSLHLQNLAMNQQQNSRSESSPSSSHSNEMSGDAEGVWSPDIDQAFHEALQIYPPCGRRKIILSEEGKMYGRNELIARYIKIRCGKTRTRKQVSSHIQVLARKKHRELQSKVKTQEVKTEDLSNPPPSEFTPPSLLTHTPLTTTAISTPSMQMASQNLLHKSMVDHAKVQALAEAAVAAVAASAANNSTLPISTNTSPDAGALAASTGLPWQYMVPGMFNNNFYGNVSMNNDENLYTQFAAAALSAQQQMNTAFGGQSNGNANGAASLIGAMPVLNKLLPQLPLNAGPSSLLGGSPPFPANPEVPTLSIKSSKLSLAGFSAYVDMTVNGQRERTEMVKIPKFADEPQDRISFATIGGKYPPKLQELYNQGPKDAFFHVKVWANIDFETSEEGNPLYAVDENYESPYEFPINVSTKLCSFGKQQVEKVEDATNTSGEGPVHKYQLEGSPMCDYMVQFITELKKLQNYELMNSVLDNFTVMQTVTDKASGETLMVICFSFEISPEPEPSCRIYKIVD